MRSGVLVAVLLALSFQARADEVSDQARAAFQKGQTEYNLGNYSEAAKLLEETYRLKPVPALLFNIAQCYRFAGNLEKAVQTYRSFLRTAPTTDKNISLAKELLDQVESALASRKKAESSAPHGLAAAPPVTGPAPPAAGDKPPEKAAVQEAVAGERKAAPAPADAVSTPSPAPAQRTRVVPWVAGGAAVVALGTGALFGMKSKSDLSGLQTGYHSRAEIDSQSASAKSAASTANLLLVAGGVLAVASGVLFALEF